MNPNNLVQVQTSVWDTKMKARVFFFSFFSELVANGGYGEIKTGMLPKPSQVSLISGRPNIILYTNTNLDLA